MVEDESCWLPYNLGKGYGVIIAHRCRAMLWLTYLNHAAILLLTSTPSMTTGTVRIRRRIGGTAVMSRGQLWTWAKPSTHATNGTSCWMGLISNLPTITGSLLWLTRPMTGSDIGAAAESARGCPRGCAGTNAGARDAGDAGGAAGPAAGGRGQAFVERCGACQTRAAAGVRGLVHVANGQAGCVVEQGDQVAVACCSQLPDQMIRLPPVGDGPALYCQRT
jgi:hypothetical protein